MWKTADLPVLRRVIIVKLLIQHVIKSGSWVPTGGIPLCWWWGNHLLMAGSKWAAIFSLS